MWPVWIFFLVQLGLREGVVEILYGHLVERNHVPELLKLTRTNKDILLKCFMLENLIKITISSIMSIMGKL